MEKKEFITPDFYLSSAISILLNLQPDFKVENGRTLFCFPATDDLYRAMTAYNNGKQAVVSGVADTEVTAVFGADGQLSGSAGCNRYNAPYTVDGDRLRSAHRRPPA